MPYFHLTARIGNTLTLRVFGAILAAFVSFCLHTPQCEPAVTASPAPLVGTTPVDALTKQLAAESEPTKRLLIQGLLDDAKKNTNDAYAHTKAAYEAAQTDLSLFASDHLQIEQAYLDQLLKQPESRRR